MLFRVRPEHRPLILQLRHYGSTVAKVMSNEKAVSKSITSITVDQGFHIPLRARC